MNKWIPVNEKKPEIGKQVLVTVAGASRKYVTTAEYVKIGKTGIWYDHEDIMVNATAWMPFPEAYKGE